MPNWEAEVGERVRTATPLMKNSLSPFADGRRRALGTVRGQEPRDAVQILGGTPAHGSLMSRVPHFWPFWAVSHVSHREHG